MSTSLGNPIERMTDIEVLEYLRHLEKERANLDAQMIKSIGRLTQLRSHVKYVGDEVAAALDWSCQTAARKVDTAVCLLDRLPDTVDALERGDLDFAKALAIDEWTSPLLAEQAREVAAIAHAFAEGRTVSALRQKLAREVIKIDPEGAQARKEERTAQRKVQWGPRPDGMAELYLYDTAERVRALYELLGHLARTAKAAGDKRTMDELRTEALMQLVLGGPDLDRVHVELRVTVPASVLAGASSQPGWLHGYGPITSETVWNLAQRSRWWRRLVTDPLTGTVMEVSRRNPPGQLREYLKSRNPTCVAVGCNRPAESSEIDHNTDYTKGGPTSADNLGPACKRHNLMKVDGGWDLTQPEPGHYTWTTPAGLTYRVPPEPLFEPDIDEQT